MFYFKHETAYEVRISVWSADVCSSDRAELGRRGQMIVTAIRYDDSYRNTADGWKIADRTINFLYYVPVAEYPDILRTLDRNHAYDEPKPADFPEQLPSWTEYEKSRGRA